MVARIPHPELPEPTREQREVAETERIIRARWDDWVERGLVAEMPAKKPMTFLGNSEG